jgi:hypothetical protein|nr:MAG TPA: hypothetical protein [Caudoviricetes sp.]
MDNTEQIYRRIKEESVDIQLLPFVNSLEGVVSLPVVQNDSLVSVQIEALKVLLNKDDKTDAKINEVKKLITSLQERINTLVGANASEAIESFNEVIKFLGSVRDSDTLNALLAKINERLSTLETTKVAMLENSVSSLRDDLTSETSNRTQSISGLDGKLTTLQGKLTEETSAREKAVSGVSSTIETLKNSISTEASTRENAVNTINIAITELKNKKVIAEDVTTTENGDTKELTLQAGKVYMLSENVDKLRIKAIAPPENTKEVAEVMLYFHTGQNGDSGVVARSGDAPMISFEGVALPKDMKIESNMFYEVSFKYNPIARKYTALVASWAIA